MYLVIYKNPVNLVLLFFASRDSICLSFRGFFLKKISWLPFVVNYLQANSSWWRWDTKKDVVILNFSVITFLFFCDPHKTTPSKTYSQRLLKPYFKTIATPCLKKKVLKRDHSFKSLTFIYNNFQKSVKENTLPNGRFWSKTHPVIEGIEVS